MKIRTIAAKAFLVLSICAVTAGCSSSSNDTNEELVGTWLSNCHELLGTGEGSEPNVYNISELTFSESMAVDNYTTYTDINCTENPIMETVTFRYTTGGNVATTDGVAATRYTKTPVIPNRPEFEIPIEAIYRTSGEELNFGEIVEGEIPSIDYRVTYTRQR